MTFLYKTNGWLHSDQFLPVVNQTLWTLKPPQSGCKTLRPYWENTSYPQMMNSSASQILWSVSSPLIWDLSRAYWTLMDHIRSAQRRLLSTTCRYIITLHCLFTCGDIILWRFNTLAWNVRCEFLDGAGVFSRSFVFWPHGGSSCCRPFFFITAQTREITQESVT